MPILTATQVTQYSNITASVATIVSSGLIAVVQDRITMHLNNYFATDLYLRGTVTFNATAATIVSDNSFEEENFSAGDDIYVYHSYRNDGYYTLDSVSGSTLTIASTASVVDELSGRSILISVVRWPSDIVYAAAQMVAYDYDVRPTRSAGVKSVSLGPWSESYGGIANGAYGYPEDMWAPLYDHRIVRLM